MYKLELKSKIGHVYHDPTMLGHYLAGVWEGDGHTKKNKSSGKTTLHITMHKQQKVYVEKLLGLLSGLCDKDPVGSVHLRHDNNSCVLNIFTPKGLTLIVQLIGDKLKTPKALQLNDVIDWLNINHNTSFLHVSFQKKPVILDTPWFAGFIDADGSFGIDLSTKTRLKVSCQFQINQRMSDPKENNLEYGSLFRAIALAIDVNLQTPMEKKSGRYYYAIKATSRKSKNILRHYFDTYPLLTSKFLDYRNWCAVDDLLKKKDHHKHLKQIQFIQSDIIKRGAV
jgi:hypothetical protein